jgi:hypothetical protein
MSKLVQSYSTSNVKKGELTPVQMALKEEMPELIAAMLGSFTIEGTCVMPPCSLILFLEGDRMGWCLTPRQGSKCAFGTLPDPSKGLAGVEAEMEAGHFEWKQKRGR